MTGSRSMLPHMVCLGCGCACDDIELQIGDGRIVEARHACERGAAWFGDGRVPAGVLVDGAAAHLDDALAAAADRLARAARPLVYLAPDLTCESQRAAVALSDCLRATVDSATSTTGLRSLLAAQERGRAGATLGEIRHRADVLLFWGVDPAVRYPRFMSRYAPEPEGLKISGGRSGRLVVAVDVGEARGPAQADRRVLVPVRDEIDVLTSLTAVLQRDATAMPGAAPAGLPAAVEEMHPLLTGARYAALVVDGEPRDGTDAAPPQLVEGLIAVTQALNDRTRAAAVVLRAGGNRSGADAVLTWQTGFPAAVAFDRGYPRYRPYDGTATARLEAGDLDAVVLIGAASAIPDALCSRMAGEATIVIGPRATESGVARRGVAIDTGVAGIHEGGIGLRMDDVPLPLRAALGGPPATEAIVRALTRRIVTNRGLS